MIQKKVFNRKTDKWRRKPFVTTESVEKEAQVNQEADVGRGGPIPQLAVPQELLAPNGSALQVWWLEEQQARVAQLNAVLHERRQTGNELIQLLAMVQVEFGDVQANKLE